MQEDIGSIIEKLGEYPSKTKGVSMRPLFKEGRDTVIFVKPKSVKKYDLVLYKVGEDKYCMHRIIGVKKDLFVIRGDNTYTKEYLLKKDIIAVAKGYYKDKKYIDVNKNFCYKLRSRLIVFIRPFVIFLAKIKNKIIKKQKSE